MIRTFITPHNTDVHITIPANYVGKELEVTVLFTDEDLNPPPKKVSTLADLKGVFNNEEAAFWSRDMKNLRNEWQRDI